MSKNKREAAVLECLTPDLAAEVRRNLQVWLCVAVGAVGAICVLFAWLVDPDFAGFGASVGVRLASAFSAMLVFVAGLLITLAYLFGWWPAFLRRRFLSDRFGVAEKDVSLAARKRFRGDPGLWAAAGQGAVVGWAFATTGLLLGWVVLGKWFASLAYCLVFIGASTAAHAWVVRRVVQQSAAATRSDDEGTAVADHKA